VDDNGNDLSLTYTSPLFKEALKNSGLDRDSIRRIIEEVAKRGSCQTMDNVPDEIRDVFVVSQDITAEEHVRMQASMQAFVDNSLSKTINFPNDALEEDVAMAYRLAWKLGCKGITVYVTGSRQKVVLETETTAERKSVEEQLVTNDMSSELWHDGKKPRPRYLHGYTFSVNTPLGKAFVTINENGSNQPFEVFINTAKAGSDTAAVSEAIGRLLSYVFRLASPVSPRERMHEVVRQLTGIGGGRPMGFGPNRVRSLPDGVSKALREYLENTIEEHIELSGDPQDNGRNRGVNGISEHIPEDRSSFKIGDLCPECGQAAFVSEEGCRKCYACSYSEC
jgi:ribonucleoside-diphosphate reductase alpha chain